MDYSSNLKTETVYFSEMSVNFTRPHGSAPQKITLFSTSAINIFSMNKLKRIRWVRHVARMGDIINSYRSSVRKPEEKRPLWKKRRTWEADIKIHLTDILCEVVDRIYMIEVGTRGELVWTGCPAFGLHERRKCLEKLSVFMFQGVTHSHHRALWMSDQSIEKLLSSQVTNVNADNVRVYELRI
jgi:hypothetical protein